jgi:hypothetical protein
MPLFAQTQKAQSQEEQMSSNSIPQDSLQLTSSKSNRSVTRMLEVGVSANAYRGDLAMKYQKWSSAFHVGLKLNHKKRVNSHFNISAGTVTGQNLEYVYAGASEGKTTPNRFFTTNFFTFNYDLQINLIKRKNWIVYVSQGIGLIRYKPKDDQDASLQSQFQTRAANETYSNVSLMLPTQAGVMYVFDNGYGAGLQTGWMNTQTDYIDNISQWGNRQKKDNVLWFRFSFIAPLSFQAKN